MWLLAGMSVPVVGSGLCSRLLQKLVELVGCWCLLEQEALLEVWLRPLLRGLVVVGCPWLLEGGSAGGGGWPEAAGASRSPATAFYYMILGSRHRIM